MPLLFLTLLACELPAAGSFSPQTRVTFDGTRWAINGSVMYPGAPAEGLLMNVRMVNATFEDAKKPEFDADANTEAFLQGVSP